MIASSRMRVVGLALSAFGGAAALFGCGRHVSDVDRATASAALVAVGDAASVRPGLRAGVRHLKRSSSRLEVFISLDNHSRVDISLPDLARDTYLVDSSGIRSELNGDSAGVAKPIVIPAGGRTITSLSFSPIGGAASIVLLGSRMALPAEVVAP